MDLITAKSMFIPGLLLIKTVLFQAPGGVGQWLQFSHQEQTGINFQTFAHKIHNIHIY